MVFRIILIGFLLFIVGCSHPLRVKNLGVYQSHSMSPLQSKGVKVGIITGTNDPYMKALVKNVGQALSTYNAEVLLPYVPQSDSSVDVEARIGIIPTYQGSGWNFLINFPGFLLFAPAWNGYIYNVHYQVDVMVVDGRSKQRIDSFQVPIHLDIRHAEFDRTWTEISWFEIGIIAFLGGLYFVQYDPDVTPILTDKVGGTLGDYIAQEVVNRINSYARAGGLQRPPG